MSELNEESGATEEVGSLEEALQKNWTAASEEEVSEDTSTDSGDVTSDETEASEIQASEEDSLEPLEKWTDEQKEVFKSLDRRAQEFLLERHKDVESYLTKETQALSESKRRYERLDEVLKPYDEALRPKGIELAPHVANALQYYFAYQQDPESLIKNLVQSAGLTPEQLFEDSDVDPSIRALQSELQQAKREIAELKRQPESHAQRELETFKSATKEDGTPKYPYFDQLKPMMAPLVSDGRSLEEAYNEALWMLPEHRKSQIEAERKKAQKEAEAKRTEKVKKAKTASDVLPSSDVEKGSSKGEFRNWEKALQDTLSSIGG